MGIEQISISNYKSLQNITINIDRDSYDLQCIIGKNGTGKSNILDAINYFYKMAESDLMYNDTYIDSNNKYIQKMHIEFIYNLKIPYKLNTNEYIENALIEMDSYVKNGKIKVKLTQYKDGSIEWFPSNKNIRKFLCKWFPIYMVDTRFITLDDWSLIWNIISDLSISTIKKDNMDFDKKLDTLLSEIYGPKYKKVVGKIESIFENENVTINNHNYSERYISALNTRLGGSEFLNNSYKINYHSDGNNSLKFIKLVIQLISYLSQTGWKMPLIIIDEPEIGLHPQLIEDLVQSISESINDRVNMIITTHSTSLITALIKNEMNVDIKRLYMKSDYTKLEKIRDMLDLNEKYLISNKETECYFSDAIVFVEGTTEMQLFQNPHIRKLFKQLRKINFYSYESNNTSLKLIYPNNSRFNVPFKVIIDMDKILKYSFKKKKFIVNQDKLINPLFNEKITNSEKYLYYNDNGKKLSTFNLHQYINKVLSKGTFEQNSSLYWLNNNLYMNLLEAINIYCREYNVYPVCSTIEGCLVNHQNYHIVKEWFMSKINQSKLVVLDDLLNRNDDIYYKVTIIRVIMNGKLDNLLTLKEATNIHMIPNDVKLKIDELNKSVGDKTGGWVNDFLDYYFNKYIKVINEEEKKLKKFKNDFPELENILQTCIYMVK